MRTGYVKWFKDNRMLVMSFLTVILLLLLDQTEFLPLAANQDILLMSFATLTVFILAWLMDVVTLKRGHTITPRELRMKVYEQLRVREIPFMLRIGSSPNPLAHYEHRFSEIVKAANFWDWTLYIKTTSKRANQSVVDEIDELYLSREVATSTFGVIEGDWPLQKDIIIVGMIISDQEHLKFPPCPWEDLIHQGSLRLEALKAFEYDWLLKDNGIVGLQLIECKAYENTNIANSLLERILKKLDEVKVVCWPITTETDWHALDKTKVRDYVSTYFAGIPRIKFRRLTLTRLRRWLYSADKLAIAVGFIGYMLSPFSPYNDLIVNIFPSFILASITAKIVNISFVSLTLFYYACSNIIGILLLMWSVKRISLDFTSKLSKFQKIAIALYVVIITLVLSLVNTEAILKRVYSIMGM